ncbi:hypothetical protein D3C71_1421780 [compost metagenome]
MLGATCQQHGIELLVQLLGRDGFLGPVGDLGIFAQSVLGGAHEHAGAKHHAFGFHLLDAAVNVRLLHLEVRNAVAQQPAHAVVLFKQRDAVASARELLCCRHARRARAHHGHLLARFVLGNA